MRFKAPGIPTSKLWSSLSHPPRSDGYFYTHTRASSHRTDCCCDDTTYDVPYSGDWITDIQTETLIRLGREALTLVTTNISYIYNRVDTKKYEISKKTFFSINQKPLRFSHKY